jgi:fluoride ion exporter CrcB/FEX
MTWQTLILNINAVACILISIRLMFFRKRSLRRRRLMEFLAYGLILAPAFTAFESGTVITCRSTTESWLSISLSALPYGEQGATSQELQGKAQRDQRRNI